MVPEISRHYIAVGIQRRLELHHDQWHMKAVDEHSGRSMMVPALRMSTVLGLKNACCEALDVDQGEVEIAAYPGMTGQPQSVRKKKCESEIDKLYKTYFLLYKKNTIRNKEFIRHEYILYF